MSPWEKMVVARASKSRSEARWLIRELRAAKKRRAAGAQITYSRHRSFRVSVGHVMLVSVVRNPAVVAYAAIAVLIYLSLAVYLIKGAIA